MNTEHIPTKEETPEGWQHSIGETGEEYYMFPFHFYVDENEDQYRCFTLIMDTADTFEGIEHCVMLSSESYNQGDCWDEWPISNDSYDTPTEAREKALELMQQVIDGGYDQTLLPLYCEQHDHEPEWQDEYLYSDGMETEGKCVNCGKEILGWYSLEEIEEA